MATEYTALEIAYFKAVVRVLDLLTTVRMCPHALDILLG